MTDFKGRHFEGGVILWAVRWYCRRDDGTTGLIVGAAIGGLLGNEVARGDSRTVGAIIGAGAGALLGREIDRGGVTCR